MDPQRDLHRLRPSIPGGTGSPGDRRRILGRSAPGHNRGRPVHCADRTSPWPSGRRPRRLRRPAGVLVPFSAVFVAPRHRSAWPTRNGGPPFRAPAAAQGQAARSAASGPSGRASAWADACLHDWWAGDPDRGRVGLAARGGLDSAEFAWGDELTPGGRWMANAWQGNSPSTAPKRTATREPHRSASTRQRLQPVRHDRQRVGWTSDWYASHHRGARMLHGPGPGGGAAAARTGGTSPHPRKVAGGSAARRTTAAARPAARMSRPIDTSTSLRNRLSAAAPGPA